MTYWHMQLHPDDKKWEREKELLGKTNLIGCGLSSGEQTDLFNIDLKIDDIVLIKRGSIPIALVKVIGNPKEIKANDLSRLDWFKYRRKVNIIAWAKGSHQLDFPSPRGTLKKSIDKKSPTYKYIDNWYEKTNAGIKLRHIYIENYKMFNQFNISLIKDNEPLPIIVIAGINGIGKTSLLEYIKNFIILLDEKDTSYIKYKDSADDSIETLNSSYINLGDKPIADQYQKSMIYAPLFQEFDHVKKDIVKYQQDIMYKKDIKPSETYQIINDNILEFLGDLNLETKFDSLDKNEQIYFRNNNDKRFSIDELSSGQKTILSKMLSFFLGDVKGKVILIDEPELSLHPSWQNKILQIYENFAKLNNCQIIIATHSPHIIGSAKNEYLRILAFDEDNNVEVISEFSEGYGLEFTKVLTKIMGMKDTRTPDIAKQIGKMWVMLENEDHKTEKYKQLYTYLENTLGSLDQDLVLARLEIAKLEAGNA